MIGKLLQIKHTLIYRWIREFRQTLPQPQISGDIKQIEFDEMGHFVDLKKENYGSLKQLIAVHEKQLPGCLAGAILQRLDDSTIR